MQDDVQQPFYNALMYGQLELAQHIVRKYGADLNTIAQVGAVYVYLGIHSQVHGLQLMI